MTRRRSSTPDTQDLAVAEQLGRLTATLEKMETARVETAARAKEDRDRTETSISRLENALDGLRNSTDAMQQTLRSTSDSVTKMALDKCGERLDKIESTVFTPDFQNSHTRIQTLEITVSRWQRWIGTGWTFLGRAALAVLASGVLGGTVLGLASKIASHLTP